MARSLAERIQAALTNEGIRIADLQLLITQGVTERDALGVAHVQATQQSVDFAMAEIDRDEAADLAAKHARNATALGAAVEQLKAKLSQKLDSETQKAKADERAALISERDELAERIAQEWPVITAAIVDLLSSNRDVGERMRRAHVNGPSPAEHARVLASNGRALAMPSHSIAGGTKVPELSGASLAWPVPYNPAETALASVDESRKQFAKWLAEQESRWAWFRISAPGGHGIGMKIRRGQTQQTRPMSIDLAGDYDFQLMKTEADRLSARGVKIKPIDAPPMDEAAL